MNPYQTSPSGLFNFSSLIGPLLVTIVISIVMFLIFRAVILWYWRVNEIVDLLKEIRENTKKDKLKEKESKRVELIGEESKKEPIKKEITEGQNW